MYQWYIKRLVDFVVALTALLLLLPLLLLLMLLLRLTGHRRVFFLQKRVGVNEKIFVLLKFRSMTEKCNADGHLLPDIERLTTFGKFMRKSSLDELPQLINVLKGDMSIVGPRPLLVEYLQYYSPEQKKRHLSRPGITGWAQVNGRNAISWNKKFELDVWYVQHIGFMLDCRILMKTVMRVIKPQGINQDNQHTMKPFRG